MALSKNVSAREVQKKAEVLIDRVPCSVGIVPWEKGMSLTDVFDWADDNMYEAKRNGKGAISFQVIPPRKAEEKE